MGFIDKARHLISGKQQQHHSGEDDPGLASRGRFLHVRLDTGLRCNLRCKMCFFSTTALNIPFKQMTIERFRIIMERIAPHTEKMALSCAAEPLMSRCFFDALKEVDSYEIPYLYLITNGTLLDRAAAERLLDSSLDKVCVSLDGTTEKTLAKIRPGASFKKIKVNLQQFIKIRDERGQTSPLLSLNMVLMHSNIREAPALVRLADELGADAVFYRHLVPWSRLDIRRESLWYHKNAANRYLDETRALAEELKIGEVAIPPNFSEVKKKPDGMLKCRMLMNEIQITTNGHVMQCGGWTGKSLGNIYRQTFEEIWSNPRWVDLRRVVDGAEKIPEGCLGCPEVAGGDVNDPRTFTEPPLLGTDNFKVALREMESDDQESQRRGVDRMLMDYACYMDLSKDYDYRLGGDLATVVEHWKAHCRKTLEERGP